MMQKLFILLILSLNLTTHAREANAFSENQQQAFAHLAKAKTVAGYLKSLKGKIKETDHQFLKEKNKGLPDAKISWSYGERNTLTIDSQVTHVGLIKNGSDNTRLAWDLNGKHIEFAKNITAEQLWPVVLGALPKEFSFNFLFDLLLPRAEANGFVGMAAGIVLTGLVMSWMEWAEAKDCKTYNSFANICDFNLKACSGISGCAKNINEDISSLANFDETRFDEAPHYKCVESVKSLRSCLGQLPANREQLSSETLSYLEKLKSVQKTTGTQQAK